MSNVYIMLPVLFILTLGKGSSAQWAYTTPAKTNDGRPCLTNCNDNCIVDWEENRMDCVTEDDFALSYKYYTAQDKDKGHEHCLSNCGYFGYEYEWCVTSNDKKWDYCNSGDNHVSVYKRPCKEHCDMYGAGYLWCHVEGGSWQVCAPPREKRNQKWLGAIN